MNRIFPIVLALVALVSCKPKENLTEATPVPAPVEVPVIEKEPVFIPSVTQSEGVDPKALGAPCQITAHEVEDRYLTLYLNYSGGCKEHVFNLQHDMQYSEGSPKGATLYLYHNSNEDYCEEWVSDTLKFDLTPIQHHEHNVLQLQISGYETPVRYQY